MAQVFAQALLKLCSSFAQALRLWFSSACSPLFIVAVPV